MVDWKVLWRFDNYAFHYKIDDKFTVYKIIGSQFVGS